MVAKKRKRPFRLRLGPASFFKGERLVMPFQRSLPALAIVTFLVIAMTVPAVVVFRNALEGWRELEGLFDLVSALFSSFWLMGWSIGLLVIWAVFLPLLIGREVLLIRPREMEVVLGIPGIGVSATYALEGVRNLRRAIPGKQSGHGWRGPHAAFDYKNEDVRVGSKLSVDAMAYLTGRLESAHGGPLRTGEPSPQEREAEAAPSPPPAASTPEPPQVWSAPPTLTSPSTLALIAANLVPVLGALLLDWNLGEVLVLYWAESGVIGIYTMAKLFVIGRWLALFACVFFLGHYGAFMAVHLLFLWGLFVKGPDSPSSDSLAEVGLMFASLWPALVALLISHGVSFYVNFLGRREYVGRKLGEQMGEPYKRIMAMHVTIIFGGFLTLLLGTALPVLLLLMALKIVTDIRGHLKERS